MQTGVVIIDSKVFSQQFPPAHQDVIPGVKWGPIEAFPSPAYWAYQAWANEQQISPINYKLGTTLREEVGACLLGGHGIPAHVGLAAFANLRDLGVFARDAPSEQELLELLSQPMDINGKSVRYRFAKQKARYLHAALALLDSQDAPTASGKALRDWLIAIPGVGYKTASWIARNWLDADDVAILDIHILRAGALGGFFDSGLTVEKHYLRLEEQFLALSHGLGVRPAVLDALMWYQMMSAPGVVHGLLSHSGLKAA